MIKCLKCKSINLTMNTNTYEVTCSDCNYKFDYMLDVVFKGNKQEYEQAKKLCKIMCN